MCLAVSLSVNSSAADQLELAKHIIQVQSNLMSFGITVLVGIAGIILAATWLYNLYVHKREILAISESLESEISSRVNERLSAEIKQVEEDLKKKTSRAILTFEAEKARIFGIISRNANEYRTSARWWAIAAKYFTMLDISVLIRASVMSLLDALNKCDNLAEEESKEINEALPSIPEILAVEKEMIRNRLRDLPKGTPLGSVQRSPSSVQRPPYVP